MRATCAISGLTFSTDYISRSIPHTAGYIHPIFAAPYTSLYSLYGEHFANKLSHTDSYLTFLAFIHSTDQVKWKHPASCEPNDPATRKLIENCFSELVSVIEKSACITHPKFKQPKFVVHLDNSHLAEIPHWIEAWQSNLDTFKRGYINDKIAEDLKSVENKLERLILSGSPPERYAHVLADWADRSAEFPEEKRELYKKTIRSCYNIDKMFNTPYAVLTELKEYCEYNLEVGSIHYHKLIEVIKGGIARHTNYLGATLGYTLLPEDSSKTDEELAAITESAPIEEPVRSNYSSDFEFLKAKLAFRVAEPARIIPAPATPTPTPIEYDYTTTGKPLKEL